MTCQEIIVFHSFDVETERMISSYRVILNYTVTTWRTDEESSHVTVGHRALFWKVNKRFPSTVPPHALKMERFSKGVWCLVPPLTSCSSCSHVHHHYVVFLIKYGVNRLLCCQTDNLYKLRNILMSFTWRPFYKKASHLSTLLKLVHSLVSFCLKSHDLLREAGILNY